MLSIGAVVVGNPSAKFYRELKPISDGLTKEALGISGFMKQSRPNIILISRTLFID